MADSTSRQFEGTKSADGGISITPSAKLKEPRIMTKFDKNNPVHVSLLNSSSPYNKNSMQGSEEMAIHPGGYFSMSVTPEKKTESKAEPKAVAKTKRTYVNKTISSPKLKTKTAKSAPAGKAKSNVEKAQERLLEAKKNKLI